MSLEDVSKSYNGTVALQRTTLRVDAHARLALVGPSGCGKSTLLRLVLGLVSPDTGRVHFGDVAVTPRTSRAVCLRAGYVNQDGSLFPHLTARENVTLVAKNQGWDATRINARLDELGTLVRLPGELLLRYPAEMSGGQRQRVGLMRALMLDPDVLLLDEPLAALDPVVRAQLQDDLVAVFERLDKTVLLVTHDMSEAAYLAETLAVMNAGEIVQRGPLKELLTAPKTPFVTALLRAHRALA